MCTLTILREGPRLLVTMNRDDIAAREEAPPALWRNAAPVFAAPRDLQAGGTWISVNADGVIACLLNRYDPAPVGRISRGAIVPEAMREASVEDACGALSKLEHRAYSPFTCVVIDQHGAARVDWTGAQFSRANLNLDEDVMLTSSSWQLDEVRAQREALFAALWVSQTEPTERISAFHSHRDSARDAWAPMMLRPQSQTKSITQIELTPDGAEMRYWSRDLAIARRLTAPEVVVRVAACAIA